MDSQKEITKILDLNTIKKNDIDILDYSSDIEYISSRMICGRVGFFGVNTFYIEIDILLKNSLVLFQKGYLDVAYYQLRSSIEMNFLNIDLFFASNRKKKITDWKNQESKQVLESMINNFKVSKKFSHIGDKMPTFFNDLENQKFKLNKKVHKQCIKEHYISRMGTNVNQNEKDINIINDFRQSFKKVMAINIMCKLFIDPSPLLLKEKEVQLRFLDPILQELPDFVIEKYELEKYLNEFKDTIYYKNIKEKIYKQKKYDESLLKFKHEFKLYYEDVPKLKENFEYLTNFEKNIILICEKIKKILTIFETNGMCIYSIETKQNYHSDLIISGMSTKQHFPFKSIINQEANNIFRTELYDEESRNLIVLQTIEIFSNKEISFIKKLFKIKDK